MLQSGATIIFRNCTEVHRVNSFCNNSDGIQFAIHIILCETLNYQEDQVLNNKATYPDRRLRQMFPDHC